MTSITEQSFGLNIRLMKFCGMYPPEKSSVFVKVRVYLFYCSFLLLNTSLMLVNLLSLNSADVMQLVISGTYTAETSAYCFKIIPFLKNSPRIKKCMTWFADPKFAPKNQTEAKIIQDCVHICRRNCTVYFYGLAATTTLWIGSKLFDHKLPADIWLPFDPMSGPGTFYATFAYIAAGTLYDAVVGPMTDPLIGGLAYHATAQMKILKSRLRNFDRKDPVEFLENCVEHHNSILDYIGEFQACFSFSILCQFAGGMFGLCFSCVGIIMDSGVSSNTLISAASVCCILFQIFVYCYYGTLLFEESRGLNDAIYMGPWYECDAKVGKILFLMMERAKIPVIITAGKVVDVTLQTFLSVLKSSYSLIAVVSIALSKYE